MISLPGRKYKLPVLMTEGRIFVMGTIIAWLFVEFFTFQFFSQRNKKVGKVAKVGNFGVVRSYGSDGKF